MTVLDLETRVWLDKDGVHPPIQNLQFKRVNMPDIESTEEREDTRDVAGVLAELSTLIEQDLYLSKAARSRVLRFIAAVGERHA